MGYQEIDLYKDMPDDADTDKWLEEQGWEDFLSLGDNDSHLYIRSHRRLVDGNYQYVLDVWDVLSGSPHILVDSFVELMDLIARWAPAIQAAALVSLIDEARHIGLSDSGSVELIAAKVAYGAQDALPRLKESERHQARMRKKLADERRATQGEQSSPR